MIGRKSVVSLGLGIFLASSACGGSVSTPAQAPNSPASAAQAMPTRSYLFTSAGKVRVTGVDVDPGFPPGCAEDCEISVNPPNALVIVWLESEGGGPVAADLTEDCEENATLIGADGQGNSCFVAGSLDGRMYVIFPVVATSPRYALRWGDNFPVVIEP